MKWVPSLTAAADDVRLEAAGERAEVLYFRAWHWAGRQQTDGFIPESMCIRLCPTHTKARIAALVREGLWDKVEGGYREADWEQVVNEVDGLRRRRDNDAQRQRRRRDRLAAEQAEQKPETRDKPSVNPRDRHATSHVTVTRLEEERDNPPNPPASRGDCDPISQPHSHCRGCGTSRRATRQEAGRAAAAAAAQADLELREAARTAPWCGACDPNGRWLTTPTGDKRCPDCNEVELLKRANRPPLAVVGAR